MNLFGEMFFASRIKELCFHDRFDGHVAHSYTFWLRTLIEFSCLTLGAKTSVCQAFGFWLVLLTRMKAALGVFSAVVVRR